MSKIRVLQIPNYFPPHIGGIETVCFDICQALKKDDRYDVKVICFNKDKNTIKENYDGIDVTRVGYQLKIASQALAKDYGRILKKTLIEFKPDVIHFHYPNPYVAHFLLKAMKETKFKGKFILFWHADIIKQKFLKMFFLSQNKALLKRADLILATSPNYLKDTDYLPFYQDKVKILPLCVGKDRENITPAVLKKKEEIREENKGKKIGFFFGRHVKYKGLKYLIGSDRYLDKEKIEIYIAGQGPLSEKLKRQARPYSNIHFLGKLSEEEINAYLLACDVFLFPSITRNEAFGISLAEALFFGKPAVTFSIKGSGVNFVSLDRVTGEEVKDKDCKAYAKAIEDVLKEENYQKYCLNAKSRAEAFFTRPLFEKNVLKIYDSLLGGQR